MGVDGERWRYSSEALVVGDPVAPPRISVIKTREGQLIAAKEPAEQDAATAKSRKEKATVQRPSSNHSWMDEKTYS